MAKTTRLTGHAAFASPFSPAFPVHPSVFRQIVRPDKKAVFSLRANRPLAKSRTFNQDSPPGRNVPRLQSGQIFRPVKTSLSLKTNRPLGRKRDF